MKLRFDVDTQRSIVCVFGLFGLMIELLATYLLGASPDRLLTGAFLSLAIGPIVTGTIETYRRNRRNGGGDGPPLPPTDDPEEDFERRMGYRLAKGNR